jgi:hypothetical protein
VFEWGERLFIDAFEEIWEVVQFITNHQKPLAIYRGIAGKIKKEDRPVGGTELLKYGHTRFCSRVMMMERYDPYLHF